MFHRRTTNTLAAALFAAACAAPAPEDTRAGGDAEARLRRDAFADSDSGDGDADLDASGRPPDLDARKDATWIVRDASPPADVSPPLRDAAPEPDATAPDDTLFCRAAPVLVGECSGCHRPGQQWPDLTLDGLRLLPGLASMRHPDRALVTPSDPRGSLLYRKIANLRARDEGGPMPPARVLEPADVEAVRAWIAGGAPVTCGSTIPDALPPPPDAYIVPDGGLPPGEGPFCEVVPVFVNRCSPCHHPGGSHPDLSAAAVAEIVNENSQMHPERPLVVPFDPPAGLLWRKVSATQRNDEDEPMPPGGRRLPPEELAVIERWITAGAPTVCAPP